MPESTFIIDCPWCKAKVAAAQKGETRNVGFDDEAGEPFGTRLVIGSCPRCRSSLVGVSNQVGFEGYDSEHDEWSDFVRVYPKPPKTFSSYRIPRVVENSLQEADRSLQSNANTAACAMLGRALEALCRDILGGMPSEKESQKTKKRRLMLGEGIKKLRDEGVIDSRLYEWSQQLHAFRNLAAHPEDISISREDVEDLQSFVYAIVEYVYDLTDRYEEFKARVKRRERRKKT